jgi:DNA-binding beta-propeller fold protein YncE
MDPANVDIESRHPVFVALLVLFATAGAMSCGESYEAPLPDRDRLHYPVGLAMHPEGRFLYVVNTNFNVRYRPEIGGTVSVVDTRSMHIRGDQSPYIPSFGGDIQLNDDASKAYVATRQGDSVVALNVAGPSGGTGVAGGALSCTDAEGQSTSDPQRCIVDRVPDQSGGTPLAADPFGLSVDTIRPNNPATGDPVPIDLVSVAYLSSENVSTISLPNRSIEGATMESAALLPGANDIERRPGTLNMYAAGRRDAGVSIFTPLINRQSEGNFGEVQALISKGGFALSPSASNVDARDMAFGPDGDTLYVITRRPDALHIIDILPADPETGEGTRHRVRTSISIEDQPSSLLVHRGADGKRRIYVSCYTDRSIQVVDPAAEVVTETIQVDGRPYDMVTDTADDRCQNPGQTCRLYVSLFNDPPGTQSSCGPTADQCGSLAMIDLDPSSSRYHRVVSKLR